MSAFQIRPYAPSDRDAVRGVCWQTAYMGGSIEYLYRDPTSWADMYTSYYTDVEPESAWVVVNSDGRVVGYLLGCVDTRKWHSELRIALRHQLTRFLWARPRTAGFWWRAGFDVLRDLGAARPPFDLARYPAHVHCNLLPEARGKGVARELFAQWHAALKARGVPGVHGDALATNDVVHGMLAKIGYRKHGAPYPVPGFRTPTGERVFGQLVLCDLTQS